jgi:hypothetical protein
MDQWADPSVVDGPEAVELPLDQLGKDQQG